MKVRIAVHDEIAAAAERPSALLAVLVAAGLLDEVLHHDHAGRELDA